VGHIPRVPLRHDRALITARGLTARLRTARRTGRPLYDDRESAVRAKQQALSPPAADLAALRTDLEALGLTTEQFHQLRCTNSLPRRAGTRTSVRTKPPSEGHRVRRRALPLRRRVDGHQAPLDPDG
jgi:hypothetical protein